MSEGPELPPWWTPVEEVTTELREISTGALFVNVDFNDLLRDYSEEDCYRMLGKLKDLLGG